MRNREDEGESSKKVESFFLLWELRDIGVPGAWLRIRTVCASPEAKHSTGDTFLKTNGHIPEPCPLSEKAIFRERSLRKCYGVSGRPLRVGTSSKRATAELRPGS